MSAHAATLSCPLCLNNCAFSAVESLRDRLIFISTNKISCPVCQDEIIGIDKLTIHLFTHIKVQTINILKNCSEIVSENKKFSEHESKIIPEQKTSRSNTFKNKSSALPTNSTVKFVKIYPKLPTIPKSEIENNSNDFFLNNQNIACVSRIGNSTVTPDTICDMCGLQFINESILKMHRCLIHNIDEKINHQTTRYDCHLCPKNFKMRGSLMVHLRVAHLGFTTNKFHAGENENHDSKNMNVFIEEKPIERNDNKQWQCDVCRKCFTTKYFLKKHKRLHTGETPYACAQCNKTFTFQQSYHKHLLYHNDEKPHTCSFCGRAFKELSTLHNHQRIHTGEKPFSCETCGKCFRQRVSYLVHRRIHTGVMPYKCTACEKSFRYKVSQRTHKCPAQPPGTVVRQAGDLVEKLKKKHAEVESSDNKNDAKYPNISEANAEIVRTGVQLSLEDTETEHFNLIAEAFNNANVESAHEESKSENRVDDRNTQASDKELDKNLEDLIDFIPDNNVPSPSEILKNLCLSKDEHNYDFNMFM